MNTKLVVLTALCGISAALSAAQPNTLTPAEQKDGWHLLFDGKSFDGWQASDKPGTFSIADGAIVVKGPRSHLFYTGPVANHDFRNFELSIDVMTKAKANSGVYFHTEWQPEGWPYKGYEVQVNNSHSDPKRTASLWSIKDNLESVAKDDVWFTLTVRVEGKHITTSVDGKLVIDFTEPTPWTPPKELAGRMIAHGTFALQGHDPGSEVHYRNIKVRVLP